MLNPTGPQGFLFAHLEDDTDECIIWPFKRAGAYGRIKYKGRQWSVHALACTLAHGPRPEGMVAAHGPCNRPLCFNPRHLSWKTLVQNHADKKRDGTHLRGEQISTARLTAADVRAIRARYAAGGVSHLTLAREYGIARTSVSRLINGESWGHIS